MYIKSVEIHNYKGFKDANIEFHPKLNVFIGSNASGKTTLLTGILKAIYGITRTFAPSMEYQNMLTLQSTDINYKEKNCSIEITIIDFPEYYTKVLKSYVYKNHTGAILDSQTSSKIDSLSNFVTWYNDEAKKSTFTVPVFKFYPAGRGFVRSTRSNDNETFLISQFEAWSNIYQGELNYNRFVNWFYTNENEELRLQRNANNFNVESPSLKGVRVALCEALKLLGYGEGKIKTEQIISNNNSASNPILIIESANNRITERVDNKSDGEKAIITLIADIAYNLSLAMDFTIDNNFLKSPGVVCIDEIESHLHPTWQREIIPILTQLFPNIQFFIATHSPQVIGSVNSESVYVCQDFNVEKVNLKTKGEDTNSLLKYIFNSTERPKEYIDLIKEIDLLIEKNAEYKLIEFKINQISEIENEDKSQDITRLVDELKLQLEAYKFDRES